MAPLSSLRQNSPSLWSWLFVGKELRCWRHCYYLFLSARFAFPTALSNLISRRPIGSAKMVRLRPLSVRLPKWLRNECARRFLVRTKEAEPTKQNWRPQKWNWGHSKLVFGGHGFNYTQIESAWCRFTGNWGQETRIWHLFARNIYVGNKFFFNKA